MYVVIRIATPFAFKSKREAMEYIDSEIASENIIDETNIHLWRIDEDGSCDPLSLEACRYNLQMGYHE